MNYKIISVDSSEWFLAGEMKVGDICETESGEAVLRGFAGWVILNDPKITYSGGCGLKVRKFVSGKVITIQIK